MVNPRLAETGVLKSEPETKKCNDLIEKQICDRQTQNLRLRDPLVGCAKFRDLVEFAETSHFSEDHSPPLILFLIFFFKCILKGHLCGLGPHGYLQVARSFFV